MARYFFNISGPEGLIEDTEGCDLLNIDSIREEALESAREIIAADIRAGRVFQDRVMHVLDDAGQTVLTLQFLDVIGLDSAPQRSPEPGAMEDSADAHQNHQC